MADQEQDLYFRPPSEANSFLVRVMHGCPHNKCTFCNLFKSVRFRRIPVEEVAEGIRRDAEDLGDYAAVVTSMYLEGGDPLALRTANLLRIMEQARTSFPGLNRFACYATARFTRQKKQDELNALGRAGLRRVYVGLESGDETILQGTNKGCTPGDLIETGEKLREAGIAMDVSIMLGIGGLERSHDHAVKTAGCINRITPVRVRIRTFVAKERTALGRDCLSGDFTLMEPHDVLRELRLLAEHIQCETNLLSEHWTNFVHFSADMPHGKHALLDLIDDALQKPRADFRPLVVTAQRG